MNKHRLLRHSACRRAGFTMVELLVTVAVMVILVTLLIVGLSTASRRAQGANTAVLMSSIKQALVSFENELGFYPPLLANDRSLLVPPAAPGTITPAFLESLQDVNSITSLAEYLIGYGNAAQDGLDGVGFRDPLSDRVWNATLGDGSVAARTPPQTGRTYGAYLEVKDQRLLGSVDASGNTFLPGEAGYDDNAPKTIMDYWGEPIVYYTPHPDPRVSLADVFVLRPFEFATGADVPASQDLSGSGAATVAMRAARFGLLSLGPDRTANRLYRFDDPDAQTGPPNQRTNFSNRDNLREFGP